MILLIELKTKTGTLSKEQKAFIKRADNLYTNVYVCDNIEHVIQITREALDAQ